MFNRRYWNRYKLRILGILIVFSIIYLFSNSKSNSSESISSTRHGFTDIHIDYQLEKYNQLKSEYQLTGLILHWKRINGVRNLVRTMLDYGDLFSHILIWNNNPNINLTFEYLSIEPNSRIRIHNSDRNIKDLAKYRSCQMAQTKACFYVDDDWDIKMYMRSLYSSFLLEPTILHSITDQFTYFTNLMWSFFDETIDLHAGFSWIGCGSVFSRDNAVRHLKLLDYFLDNEENRHLLPQGDQFFAIWMNQLPAQFNGRMLHSSEGAGSSFENYDFAQIQHRASVLAIESLEKTLRTNPNSNLFERKRASNSLATYTKSPCSYNDKFTFFTNCLPIDNLEKIPFNITTDSKRGTRMNLPNTSRNPYHKDLSFFEKFSTANAVDNDSSTCWKTKNSLRTGDLFGIDFQTIQTNRDLSFSIEYLHDDTIQKNAEISISLDSRQWLVVPRTERTGINYNKDKKLVTFHTRLFPDGFQVFRFIKFTSLNDETSAYHICEVKLIH